MVGDLFAIFASVVRREREYCEAVLVQVEVEGSAPLDDEARLLPLELHRHHGQPNGASRLEYFLPGIELTHGTRLDEVGPLVIGVHHPRGEVRRLDPEVLSQEVTQQERQGDWGQGTLNSYFQFVTKKTN